MEELLHGLNSEEELAILANVAELLEIIDSNLPLDSAIAWYESLAKRYVNTPYNSTTMLFAEHGASLALSDSVQLPTFQFIKARLLRRRGDYIGYSDLIYKALEISVNTNNTYNVAYAYNAIGITYADQNSLNEALHYFYKSKVEYQKIENHERLATTHYNIAFTYLSQGQKDSTKKHFEASLAEAEIVNDTLTLGWIYDAMASIYLSESNLAAAKENLNRSLAYREGNPQLLSRSYVTRAKIFIQEAEADSALHYLETALEYATSANAALEHRDILEQLSVVYDTLGEPETALEYHRAFKTLSDSLRKTEISQHMAKLENQIAWREDRKAERDAYQRKLKVRQATQVISWAGFIMVLILVIYIGRAYRKKQASNVKLEGQNVEIKEHVVAVESQKDHLDNLVKTKDRLFSIISHDLRGPIQSFTSLSFLLKDEFKRGGQEEVERLLDALDTNSKSLSQLLNNLLNWAMQQQGLLPHNPEVIPLSECVLEVMGVFRFQAKTKGITLSSEVPTDLSVYADNNSLMTILRNLISNALKFTMKGGEVRVTAYREQQNVAFMVSDTGIGMTPEIMGKLFEVTGDKVNRGTAGEKGTGLGLPLVKDFVEANHGTISVDSSPGQGSTFTVKLPTRPK